MQRIIIGVIGAIVVAFTITAFFLLSISATALNLTALGFLLLAQIIICGGVIALVSMKAEKAFLRFGIAGTLFLYGAATGLSMLFVPLFQGNTSLFLLIQLGILTASVVVFLLIAVFSRTIKAQDESAAAGREDRTPKRGGF